MNYFCKRSNDILQREKVLWLTVSGLGNEDMKTTYGIESITLPFIGI